MRVQNLDKALTPAPQNVRFGDSLFYKMRSLEWVIFHYDRYPSKKGKSGDRQDETNTEDSHLTNQGERSGMYHFLMALRGTNPADALI